MLFRTHLLFSLLIGSMLFSFFDINPFLFVFFVVVGGMLPDIDKGSSKINNTLFVTKPIAFVTRHRGIFHSIFLALLVSGALAFYNIYEGIALFIGYTSHLLIDSLNYAGVKWLHPIPVLHVKGFIETGSITEHILTVVLGISVLVRMWYLIF